jgi:hypothetical protein
MVYISVGKKANLVADVEERGKNGGLCLLQLLRRIFLANSGIA